MMNAIWSLIFAKIQGLPMTPAERRKKEIVEHLSLSGSGLEYGPLHRTIVDKKNASVRYVDYADRDYLVRHYANDPNVDTDTIPEIDIVTGGRPIDEFAEKESVDFIIASHVAEHVPI
jgi:hypothetical protein